ARGGPRPGLEPLEDRTVLSSYSASSVAELIADINAANAAGGSNTITLAPGKTFTLTAADNTNVLGYGDANGLPVIAANDNLTIVGNGDTIERSTATETPWFRLFEVASGASLSLAGLTLQGGRAGDRWGGGAIYSQGSLRLNSVVVQDNIARNVNQGGISQGGGIYSSGSLTVTSSTIQNNQAVGIDAGPYGDGGSAQGGGLYVLGTASLTSVTTASNTAQGGNGGKAGWIYWDNGTKTKIAGGNGGDASGGGIYIGAGATVDLHNGTVTGNSAIGGQAGAGGGGRNGIGEGGGLFIEPLASVCLDAFTVARFTKNKASTRDPNISGSYTTCT
ncbi:MAG: hypothetical protein LC745_10200, partial [Planctomycetia bacterium]|nr:hypothetical protein [Planctomycetia bacterium]